MRKYNRALQPQFFYEGKKLWKIIRFLKGIADFIRMHAV